MIAVHGGEVGILSVRWHFCKMRTDIFFEVCAERRSGFIRVVAFDETKIVKANAIPKVASLIFVFTGFNHYDLAKSSCYRPGRS